MWANVRKGWKSVMTAPLGCIARCNDCWWKILCKEILQFSFSVQTWYCARKFYNSHSQSKHDIVQENFTILTFSPNKILCKKITIFTFFVQLYNFTILIQTSFCGEYSGLDPKHEFEWIIWVWRGFMIQLQHCAAKQLTFFGCQLAPEYFLPRSLLWDTLSLSSTLSNSLSLLLQLQHCASICNFSDAPENFLFRALPSSFTFTPHFHYCLHFHFLLDSTLVLWKLPQYLGWQAVAIFRVPPHIRVLPSLR